MDLDDSYDFNNDGARKRSTSVVDMFNVPDTLNLASDETSQGVISVV